MISRNSPRHSCRRMFHQVRVAGAGKADALTPMFFVIFLQNKNVRGVERGANFFIWPFGSDIPLPNDLRNTWIIFHGTTLNSDVL